MRMPLHLYVAVLICISGARPAQARSSREAVELNRTLTLRDAMQLAANRNLGLLQDALERRRKALNYDSARSTFMPRLSLETHYGNSTPFDVSLPRDQRLLYGAAIHWTAPLGTRLAVSGTIDQRLRGQTQQSQAVNTSNHSSNVALSVTQPLLKGAGRTGAANALAEARLDAAIQRQLFREQLNALLQRVETAYWALVFSQVEVRAKQRARDRAQRQFDDTKENIRRGIIAKIEIYLVEENLVFFRQELVKAEQRQALARRTLAEMLHLRGTSALVARDPLSAVGTKLPDRDDSIKRGVGQSPSLAAAQLRLSKERVRLRFERNQALPSLDLVGSLKLNGLDSDYAEHLSQVARVKRPEATVGFTLSLPLSFAAYRAKVSQAKLAAEKQLLKLKQQELAIRHEVARLVERIRYETRRLTLARRRVELSRLKLKAEVQKYKNGISTLDSIVRFQRELDQATLGVSRVQQEIAGTHSRLSAISGSLHRTHGIRIEG